MAEINGSFEPAFTSVRDLLLDRINADKELGASICVNIDGKDVVDIWGGYADKAKTQPWKEDTIVPVWSSSKPFMSLAVLILIDRGVLDPYAPVAKYWPEFAVNGKENVEVRHFLSHTAGLPSWDLPIDKSTIFNVPEAVEKLAQQKPWWEPGTASGYHLASQGHLLGELVRRVTGKSMGEFIKDEITGPRDADFHLPVPEDQWSRIAEMIVHPPMELPDIDTLPIRAFRGTPISSADCQTPEFRRSGIGAIGGFGNARGVNRGLSIVTLGGTVDGRQFLKPETIDLIFKEQANGVDLVLGMPVRFGLGFGLPSESNTWVPAGKTCYWGGYGGSIVIMDLDRRITITYAMNKMGAGMMGNENTGDYVNAVYAAVDAYKANL